uniref:Uncharacterized protein n=1 Tax=Arundo donax TaxID=35708 RepID=A0A0A8Y6Q1_ARUDO
MRCHCREVTKKKATANITGMGLV